MINITAKAKVQQLIEAKDNTTGAIKYLIEKNGQWIPISKEEYEQKKRGE